MNEEKVVNKKGGKRKFHLVRILILVVVFCIVVFGAVIASDWLFPKDDPTASEPEIVVITVSGENIVLNDDKQVSFSVLEEYLETMNNAGDLFTIALINDTVNPADYTVYNNIVDLLATYDIHCEKLTAPATGDEALMH